MAEIGKDVDKGMAAHILIGSYTVQMLSRGSGETRV
jgi:hypothetical protein